MADRPGSRDRGRARRVRRGGEGRGRGGLGVRRGEPVPGHERALHRRLCGSADMSTKVESDTINFIQAINRALDDAMAADDSVFLIGEDIADEEGGGVYKA